jgi:hypothetical protein
MRVLSMSAPAALDAERARAAALREALESVRQVVHDETCPIVWKTAEPRPHSHWCRLIRAALEEPGR